MEKLDFLIEYLLKENLQVRIDKLPTDIEDKKNLWRSLCNIREPKPISKEYLQVETEYLQEELNKRNITEVENIKTISETIQESNLENKNLTHQGNQRLLVGTPEPCYIHNKDKICLWQGDITTLQIDSIVNAANSQGLGCFVPCHKCIDNQINTFAGISLRLECNEIMKGNNYFLHTGKAFITKGYNLLSKYVIHTVGPIIYSEVTEKERLQLVNCYKTSLELAVENGIRTIAFPCISTGEFRFPKEEACKLAIFEVENFLKEHREDFDKIIFNVYGEEDYSIYERYIRKSQ